MICELSTFASSGASITNDCLAATMISPAEDIDATTPPGTLGDAGLRSP